MVRIWCKRGKSSVVCGSVGLRPAGGAICAITELRAPGSRAGNLLIPFTKLDRHWQANLVW
eukprot:scaffold17249_cov71-Cyclotella_meneghiniana.AAC.4